MKAVNGQLKMLTYCRSCHWGLKNVFTISAPLIYIRRLQFQLGDNAIIAISHSSYDLISV